MATCPGPRDSTAGCGRPVEQPTPGRTMLRCQRCMGAQSTVGPPPAPPTTAGRRCTWLDEHGAICDAQLTQAETDAGELFCAHHPGANIIPIGRGEGEAGDTGRVWMPVIPEPPAPPPAPARRAGALEASHLVALTAIGRHDKPDGLLVLYLARQLDEGQSGTAVAAISGRLMAAAQVAYAGAPPDPSELDRLRARRSARVAALTGMDDTGDA